MVDLSEQTAASSLAESTGSPGVPAYAVKLAVFEGPLDLLLHLIRQNDVEIADIPIAAIGAQYLEYLEMMQALDLDLAGEFLVMAATLALIKSRMLLPPEGDEEDEDFDPRAELVARLLEYQRFKEAAESLAKRRRLGRDVYAATGAGPERPRGAEREIEVGVFDLIQAFKSVLDRQTGPAVHEIEVEVVTLYERMQIVMQQLSERDNFEFMQIFRTEDGAIPSRSILVATFLAILELVKGSACTVFQGIGDTGSPEGPIRVRRGECNDWQSLVSDAM